MRRAFDELRYGQMSPTPLVGVGQLTQHDPSRCPEGKAIFHAWDYVPYERPDGRSWDEAKGEFADQMIARMGNYIDDIAVLDYHCDSPVERHGDPSGTTMVATLPLERAQSQAQGSGARSAA